MRKFLTMCLGLAILAMAIPTQVFAQSKYEVKGVVVDTTGTPVIGAEVGGIPELIREGDGMLFRMGDKEELASAIVSVMSKDNVDTQGIARRAQKRFSEERYWAELKSVYDL